MYSMTPSPPCLPDLLEGWPVEGDQEGRGGADEEDDGGDAQRANQVLGHGLRLG